MECVICLEPLDTRRYETQLSCEHVYHTRCISNWLRQSPSCPTCRTDVAYPPDLPTVLTLAQDARLFNQFEKSKHIATLYPSTGGSFYLAAIECAKAAHAFQKAGNPLRVREELAYMLVYLHISGDFRAEGAAKRANIQEAIDMSNRLVEWSVRPTTRPHKRPLVRRIFRCIA